MTGLVSGFGVATSRSGKVLGARDALYGAGAAWGPYCGVAGRASQTLNLLKLYTLSRHTNVTSTTHGLLGPKEYCAFIRQLSSAQQP